MVLGSREEGKKEMGEERKRKYIERISLSGDCDEVCCFL